MYIDSHSASNIRATSVTPRTTPSAGRGRSGESLPDRSTDEYTDGVQLSRLSAVLNGLAAGASAGEKRIGSLAALVQSGAYQVNSAQVSQRMIDDALTSH